MQGMAFPALLDSKISGEAFSQTPPFGGGTLHPLKCYSCLLQNLLKLLVSPCSVILMKGLHLKCQLDNLFTVFI